MATATPGFRELLARFNVLSTRDTHTRYDACSGQPSNTPESSRQHCSLLVTPNVACRLNPFLIRINEGRSARHDAGVRQEGESSDERSIATEAQCGEC